MNTQAILDQMSLIVVNISLWEGRKTLYEEHLADHGIDTAKLTKKTINSLGSRRIVMQQSLKVFSSLKREALSLCENHGIRFVRDGYVVPQSTVVEICQELQRLRENFETAKAGFLDGFEEKVRHCVTDSLPEWVPFIEVLRDVKQHVNKTLSFNFAAVEMKVPESIGSNGLDDVVNGLYDKLCRDVRAIAQCSYDYSFVGKDEVTARALRPIKAIRSKLGGLKFLDPAIETLIREIDDTLEKMPKRSGISGTALQLVAELVGNRLAAMGLDYSGKANGKEEEDSINIPEHSGKVAPIAWDF